MEKSQNWLFNKPEIPDWLYTLLPIISIILGFIFAYFFNDSFSRVISSLLFTYALIIISIRIYHKLKPKGM